MLFLLCINVYTPYKLRLDLLSKIIIDLMNSNSLKKGNISVIAEDFDNQIIDDKQNHHNVTNCFSFTVKAAVSQK